MTSGNVTERPVVCAAYMIAGNMTERPMVLNACVTSGIVIERPMVLIALSVTSEIVTEANSVYCVCDCLNEGEN